MNIGLYQNAASLGALERWQDAVSQNVTSSQVTGYKRRTVQMSGLTAGEILPNAQSKPDSGEGVPSIFPQTRYAISFLPGENQPTRRELDLAIAGDGFFNVRTPDGDTVYTRAGQLSVRSDRTLMSSTGGEILSADGDPIVLRPEGGEVVFNEDGTVRQGDAILGRLAITKPGNPARLTALSAGVFSADASAGMTAVEKPVVQQGYLEASNIAPLREMVDLVNIARAYEANQKLIQSRDKLMERTLETLT